MCSSFSFDFWKISLNIFGCSSAYLIKPVSDMPSEFTIKFSLRLFESPIAQQSSILCYGSIKYTNFFQ